MRTLHRTLQLLVLALCASSASHAAGAPRFSGTAFFDYFYVLQGLTGTDDNAFQFRRVYFTYDQDMSDEVTWRFRLESENGDVTSKGRLAPFVKHAYVQWSDAIAHGTLLAGLAPTPHFETSERLWGYRSVEKVQMDYRGAASTTDIGASLRGWLGSSHRVEYHVMAANGNGIKPENNRQKRAYATLRMLPGAAIFEVTADYEGRPGRSDVFLQRALLGYEGHSSALAAEFFHRTQRGSSPEMENTDAIGASATIRGRLSETVSAFARGDYYNPQTDVPDNDAHEGLIVAGVDWKPGSADVHLVPNVEIGVFNESQRDTDVLARLTLVANIK